MSNLKELLKAIDRLQDMYDCNHEVMDADDQGDLLSTIEGLKTMYHNTYKKQVIQFIEYLHSTPDGDNEWKQWSEQPYTITHGNKSVVIDNYADVYDGLLTLLEDHLKDLQ